MNRVQSDSYWYDVGYKTAKKETIGCVLEIIEGLVKTKFYSDGGVEDYIEDVEGLIDAVESLKGDD